MATQSTPQTPEQIAAIVTAYLTEYPAAVLSEDGRVLFDLRTAKYSLSTDHNRCTLHLWNDETNLVRRITAAVPRAKLLRLATQRFGQAKSSALEFSAEKDRRTPSTRETTRTRYLKLLERVLTRHFAEEGWRPEAFRTSMDLEKSFGPAYARGLLTRATQAWAVIAINDEESLTTIDGILTFGILWLAHLRDTSRQHIAGLKLILPRGTAALTLARLAWLRDPQQFQLFELDQREENLTLRDPSDAGNLTTHLNHAPNPDRARARFAESAERVLALIPPAARDSMTQRLRTPPSLASCCTASSSPAFASPLRPNPSTASSRSRSAPARPRPPSHPRPNPPSATWSASSSHVAAPPPTNAICSFACSPSAGSRTAFAATSPSSTRTCCPNPSTPRCRPSRLRTAPCSTCSRSTTPAGSPCSNSRPKKTPNSRCRVSITGSVCAGITSSLPTRRPASASSRPMATSRRTACRPSRRASTWSPPRYASTRPQRSSCAT